MFAGFQVSGRPHINLKLFIASINFPFKSADLSGFMHAAYKPDRSFKNINKRFTFLFVKIQ